MGDYETFSYAVFTDTTPDGRCRAYIPTLLKYGAIAWGKTDEEALRLLDERLQEVAQYLKTNDIPPPELTELDQKLADGLQDSLARKNPELLKMLDTYEQAVERGDAPVRAIRFDLINPVKNG